MRIDLSSEMLRVRDYYRIAWGILKKHRSHASFVTLWILIPGALVDFLIFSAFHVAPDTPGEMGYDFLASTAGWIFQLFAFASMTLLTRSAVQEEETSTSDLVTKTWQCYPAVLGLSIVVTVLVLLGLVFFIVPGLLIIVWTSFAAEFVILDREGVLPSLSRSRQLVKGRFWHVVGMSLALMLPFVIVGLILQSALIFEGGRVVSVLISSILQLFVTVAWTLFYLNARAMWNAPVEVKEGFMSREITGQRNGEY